MFRQTNSVIIYCWLSVEKEKSKKMEFTVVYFIRYTFIFLYDLHIFELNHKSKKL